MLDLFLEGESSDEPLRTKGNRAEDNLSSRFRVRLRKSFSWCLTTLSRIAICRLLMLSGGVVMARGTEFPLFVETGAVESPAFQAERRNLPLAAQANRLRKVVLNPDVVTPGRVRSGDTLRLELFHDAAYTAVVDRIVTNVAGTVTVRARVIDSDFGYLMVSTTDGRGKGVIRVPKANQRFRIQSDPDGDASFLLEMDAAKIEDPAPSVPLIPPPSPDEDSEMMRIERAVKSSGLGPSDHARIDVMVVYTPAARSGAGGMAEIANIVAQAMEKAQLSLDNSDTWMSVHLVHSAEIDYEESGNSGADLRRLTASPEFNPWGDSWGGYDIPEHMDEVHEWRDEYGADLVALFTETGSSAGLAWVLSSENGRPNYGFSISRRNSAAANYTHAHEMGHNKGLAHDVDNASVDGLFDYSYGWRWTGNNQVEYRSIMAYSPGEQVLHFSSPEILHQEVPTGTLDADNARSLREIKHVIAAYREDPSTLHEISGFVRTAEGVGIHGVTMYGLPGNPTTSADGSYRVFVEDGWSGSVAPGKSGYAFEPSSWTYENVNSDDSGQSYTGIPLSSAVATYTGGEIPTDYGFQELPGQSGCPGILTVTIPENATIYSVDAAYTMTADNNGWMSEQRSWLRCVSSGGSGEEQIAIGEGTTSGTYAYERTGLDIANDVTGGGDIIFELHAGRTWGGSGCETTHNKVDDGSWSVTVHYLHFDEIPDLTVTEIAIDSDLVTLHFTRSPGGGMRVEALSASHPSGPFSNTGRDTVLPEGQEDGVLEIPHPSGTEFFRLHISDD